MYLNIYINYIIYINWGLGIGDWGLGVGDWGIGPIPNPQYPNPHTQTPFSKNNLFFIYI
jgi:hypothetical protein